MTSWLWKLNQRVTITPVCWWSLGGHLLVGRAPQNLHYTVEAGTFSDCWRRKQNGYDVWEIYCHGMGMVRSHNAAWGGDSSAELLSIGF